MTVMNTFMNMSGGELTKDLTSFVSHTRGTIDYARYLITPYTGSKSSIGIEANATHVFWGMIHFSDAVKAWSEMVITIPESYKNCANARMDVVNIDTGGNIMDTAQWEINNDKTTLTFNCSYAFQGFIFLSFLCYK